MSLILCPECGAKISDKATHCPYCGFQSADPSRPISEQDKYEILPSFEFDIEGWQTNNKVISHDNNKSLIKQFGNWKKIQLFLPEIAEVILSRAQAQNIMVAKMDDYVKELIDKGVYKFIIDKNGKTLPTICDGQKIIQQVRLENMTLPTNYFQALNNLVIHASMIQILDEIEYLEKAIREIHIELQNDRIAKADSAKAKLKQAMKIKNSVLRENALLNVINSATDAKCTLMRNFTQNLSYVKEHYQKNTWKKNEASSKAADALNDLIAITQSVQTECVGYTVLDEFEPFKLCLEDFRNFIMNNELDKRDTLLLLNESSYVKKKDIVDKFCDMSKRISEFDVSQIEYQSNSFLTLKNDAGDDYYE